MPLPVDSEGGGGVGVNLRMPQPLSLDDGSQYFALLPQFPLLQTYGAPLG